MTGLPGTYVGEPSVLVTPRFTSGHGLSVSVEDVVVLLTFAGGVAVAVLTRLPVRSEGVEIVKVNDSVPPTGIVPLVYFTVLPTSVTPVLPDTNDVSLGSGSATVTPVTWASLVAWLVIVTVYVTLVPGM